MVTASAKPEGVIWVQGNPWLGPKLRELVGVGHRL